MTEINILDVLFCQWKEYNYCAPLNTEQQWRSDYCNDNNGLCTSERRWGAPTCVDRFISSPVSFVLQICLAMWCGFSANIHLQRAFLPIYIVTVSINSSGVICLIVVCLWVAFSCIHNNNNNINKQSVENNNVQMMRMPCAAWRSDYCKSLMVRRPPQCIPPSRSHNNRNKQ